MHKRAAVLFSSVALAATLSSVHPAFGALGAAPEQNLLAGESGTTVKRSAAVRSGYTVQESSSDVLSIREYVGPDGIVFGVAWNGMGRPDLEKLLGSYYADYSSARQQTPPDTGRRSRRLDTDKIVVETWGFMRDRHGRAYVPGLIPAGVTNDEIQ